MVHVFSVASLLLEADTGFVPCHFVSTCPDWSSRVQVPHVIGVHTSIPIIDMLRLRKPQALADTTRTAQPTTRSNTGKSCDPH